MSSGAEHDPLRAARQSPNTARLDNQTLSSRRQYSAYAIVGKYADNHADFVRHVALLASDTALPDDSPVNVWHMGPPLIAGTESISAAHSRPECRADIVSDICLSPDERNAMANWRAKVDKEKRPRQLFQHYVVIPHYKWVRAENGRRLYRRFSCAGFVLECYRSAEIQILDTDATLPLVDEQILSTAYPDLVRTEAESKRLRDRLGFRGREDLGLDRDGPWQIILPGYLFHSLQRASATNPRPLPYAPGNVDESRFPSTGT